jgi:hypothetical protein
MQKGEQAKIKKVVLSVAVGGKKKPVTKEALVCNQTGKIIRFLEKN